MDIKELNGEVNCLREQFLSHTISRRAFVLKLAKLGLSAPVAVYVLRSSGFFGPRAARAAEELMSMKMLPPIEMQDNSKYKKEPPWRVGFANPGVNNSWRVCMQACIEYQLSLTPQIKQFIQTDAGEKAEKEINDIEDLMGKNLDALMVNPVTSEALIPIMEKVYDAGIPSVTVDRWVETEKVACRTSSEHQDVVGEAFANYIGQQLPDGGNLAWVVSIVGVPEHDRRQASFERTIKKYPKVKVVGKTSTGTMQPAACKKALADIVTKNPKIDAVFCDVGFIAPAFLDVFLERNLPVPIITADDVNGWFRLCKKYSIKSISGSWPVYCGRTGIKAIELILSGKPTPKVWWIPVVIITEENRDHWYRPNLPDGFWSTTEVPEKWLIEQFDLVKKLT